MTLRTLFPYYCDDTHAGHPPFALVKRLAVTDLRAELWVIGSGPRARGAFVREGLPRELRWIVAAASNRLSPGSRWTNGITERRFSNAFVQGDAAWVHRGCSLGLMRRLRDRGHTVFLERANTMEHTAQRLIGDAFARAGWPFELPYARKDPEEDRQHVLAADFVFSPSPAVTDSLLEQDLLPRERILETSYGWEPARFSAPDRALAALDGPTFLFVGGIGLRKGAHLLLDAWSRAGVAGRLVMVGAMEPLVARRCTHHLSRADVIHHDFDPDPGRWYRCADVFVLPTIEEGSPLVTYEAMAHGLPILTSPIGAGRVVRHEVEGLVMDPHDGAALVRAIQRLAEDRGLRQQLGAAARERAADYTWDKVAEKRYALIMGALSSTAGRSISKAPPR